MVKTKRFCLSAFVFLLGLENTKAQNIQYSQYYANYLYLNPAFAGTSCTRFGASFRDQWPNLQGKYISYSFFADHYFSKIRGGGGLLATHDRINNAGIVSTSLSGIYSQHIKLADNLTFLVALQGTYQNRALDYSDLTYNDQYNTSLGYTGAISADYSAGRTQHLFHLTAGTLLFSKNGWLGMSAQHLNQARTSVLVYGSERWPLQMSLHGGYKVKLNEAWSTYVTPTFQYKFQRRFDQLDFGTYVTFEPIQIGVWYRGIPFKHYSDGVGNSESIVFLAGFQFEQLRFGYSYDWVVSSLTSKSGGAHEISLGYTLCHQVENVGKKRKVFKYKQLPCPKF